MRVLVTGATGFVGRWLVRELRQAGHEPIGAPGRDELDITSHASVDSVVSAARPDAIVHLAGMAYGPDARRDPDRALAVNAGGTRAVLEAASRQPTPSTVIIVSSSEVYGRPEPADLPLAESAPLRADQPYGHSKIAAERVATEYAARGAVPVVIARPFNHTGPGQRLEFVVPALAARILAARDRGERSIRAGNVDVRRDFSDVRDVVRAYRLLAEGVRRGAPTSGPAIYNIASGRSVSIRVLVERLAGLSGAEMAIETDPELVRQDDPPDIRGDASRLVAETGWEPQIPLERTLRDVLADVGRRPETTSAGQVPPR
jgi:GDP-4-dehydro-6-deoxy-D-mannose reductase